MVSVKVRILLEEAATVAL